MRRAMLCGAQDRQLDAADEPLYIELLAAAVTPQASSACGYDASAQAEVVQAVRASRQACQHVGRDTLAVETLCESSTAPAAPTAEQQGQGGGGRCWLDVPVAAAGLLFWARAHCRTTVDRCVVPSACLCWYGRAGSASCVDIWLISGAAGGVLCSVDRLNIHGVQALLHLAQQAASRQPALVTSAVALIADVLLLTESSNQDENAVRESCMCLVVSCVGWRLRWACLHGCIFRCSEIGPGVRR